MTLTTPAETPQMQAMTRALCEAVAANDRVAMRRLLRDGVDVNRCEAESAAQHSPLYLAARRQPEIVEMLLAWDADVNAQNVLGDTALHAVCERTPSFVPEVLHALLEAGARTDIPNRHGQTARDLLNMREKSADYDAMKTLAVLNDFDQRPVLELPLPQGGLKAQLFEENGKSHTPLDAPANWRNFHQIGVALLQQGEPLSKDELMQCDKAGESLLQKSIRYRALDGLLEHLHQQGERITVDEWLQQPDMLALAERKGVVRSLFTLEHMRPEGVEGVNRLYQALSEAGKDQISNVHSLRAGLQREQPQLERGGR